MIFTIKPLLVPSLEGGFQGEVEKVTLWVRLNADTTDHLPLSGAWLILQEEVMLEEGEVGVDGEISFTQMNENDDLED
jgi:hypothetical protein